MLQLTRALTADSWQGPPPTALSKFEWQLSSGPSATVITAGDSCPATSLSNPASLRRLFTLFLDVDLIPWRTLQALPEGRIPAWHPTEIGARTWRSTRDEKRIIF